MNLHGWTICGLATALLLATSGAGAHDGATGVVKERMEIMKKIGKATKTIGLIVKGDVEFDAERVSEAASTIEEYAGEELVELFPHGSDHGPSEALPAIWNQPDDFAATADKLEQAAAALAVAAPEGIAAIGPAFGQMTRTCKTCHQDFREAN